MANGLILLRSCLILTGLLIFPLRAEETNTSAPTPPPLVTQPSTAETPVTPTPPKQPKVIIDTPRENEVLKKSNAEIFIHVQDSPTSKNRFHVFLDHKSPILYENEPKPIVLKNLAEGGHIVRILMIQPNGLAMPLPDSLAAVRFFVKKKNFRNFVDLTKPYITVNSPTSGIVALDNEQRVCLDFLVHNATLGEKDDYKVRYTLNSNKEILDEVKPIYWSDLPPGIHSLTVELLDPSGNPALGLFSRVERKFEIAPVLKPLPTHPPPSDDDALPED